MRARTKLSVSEQGKTQQDREDAGPVANLAIEIRGSIELANLYHVHAVRTTRSPRVTDASIKREPSLQGVFDPRVACWHAQVSTDATSFCSRLQLHSTG